MPKDEMTRAGIKRALTANRKAREEAQAKLEELFEQRDELYLAARSADPPIVVREIADLAGVTEVAVNKQVAKARARAAS